METRRFGRHGLALSTLGLGTLTWGHDTGEEDASEMLATYLEAGGNTLDVPSDWRSPLFEGRVRAVGATVAAGASRQNLTLIFHSGNLPEPALPGRPSRWHLGPPTSKRNLVASLDEGLRDLGTDAVDLWVIHGPLDGVDITEVVEAAQFALSTGRTMYVGLAGLSDWDLGAATHVPMTLGGVAGLAAPLSLLRASVKTTLVRNAIPHGLGFVALSPLAQGVLTGKYRNVTPPDSRAASTHLSPLMEGYFGSRSARVVEAIARTAQQLDSTPAEVSIAWVLAQPGVTAAVVGPRTPRQLESLLKAPQLHLQRELLDVLSEVAVP